MSAHEEAAKRLRGRCDVLDSARLVAASDLALVLEEYERRGAKAAAFDALLEAVETALYDLDDVQQTSLGTMGNSESDIFKDANDDLRSAIASAKKAVEGQDA